MTDHDTELVMLRERAEAAEARVAELERLEHELEATAVKRLALWQSAEADARHAATDERAAIVAHAVETANGIVIDGTHSVDYWCGFRDALECFARNVADGAHLDGAKGGDR